MREAADRLISDPGEENLHLIVVHNINAIAHARARFKELCPAKDGDTVALAAAGGDFMKFHSGRGLPEWFSFKNG